MARSFTPGAYAVVTIGEFTEYSTEDEALEILKETLPWGVLLRITKEGKPLAIQTKGLNSSQAFSIMMRYS